MSKLELSIRDKFGDGRLEGFWLTKKGKRHAALHGHDTRRAAFGRAEGCDCRQAGPDTYGDHARAGAFRAFNFSDLSTKPCILAETRSSVASIVGIIRAGHTPKEKSQLVQAIWKAFQNCTGVSDRDLSIALQEVAPSQAMENGVIMPDVGREKEPS